MSTTQPDLFPGMTRVKTANSYHKSTNDPKQAIKEWWERKHAKDAPHSEPRCHCQTPIKDRRYGSLWRCRRCSRMIRK